MPRDISLAVISAELSLDMRHNSMPYAGMCCPNGECGSENTAILNSSQTAKSTTSQRQTRVCVVGRDVDAKEPSECESEHKSVRPARGIRRAIDS